MIAITLNWPLNVASDVQTIINISYLFPNGSLLVLSNLFCAVSATSFFTEEPDELLLELYAGEQMAKSPYSTTSLSRFRVWMARKRPLSLKS